MNVYYITGIQRIMSSQYNLCLDSISDPMTSSTRD